MSRAYDMHLQVSSFEPKRRKAIKKAAEENWPFDWFTDSPTLLAGMGESSLCGGEGEQEFAQRLARAIWQAQGGYCQVIVTATYLESRPHEDYEFQEADYLRLTSEPSEGCDCELPGPFHSGVPGILARIEDGRLAPDSEVQRCDACKRFASDEVALAKLIELGVVPALANDFID